MTTNDTNTVLIKRTNQLLRTYDNLTWSRAMEIALTSFDDFHNADDNGLAAFEHWIDQARKDEQERIGYKQAAELEALSLRIESGIEIEEIPEIEI